VAFMTAAYDVRRRGWRHPVPDLATAMIALTAVAGVWLHTWPLSIALGATALVGWRSCTAGVLCIVVGLGGLGLGERSWAGAHPRHLGPYTGWVTIVGDPAPFDTALRVTVAIEGERFDAWVYGSSKRRLAPREAGEQVFVQGTRRALTTNARRAQVRHVVGRFDVRLVTDTAPGSPLQRASSHVRDALRASAESTMPSDEAALFTGLVIGDDSRQPSNMIEAFRSSGLSHLTAVSGQNVAFMLAAATPLLRRLRPWPRWATSVALIGWFMALTRFEPSVLRAGFMAIFAVSGFALGRQYTPVRLLSLAVTVLVLIDPLLVWSVGFWLSVGATAGVCVAGPWLTARLPGPQWMAAALGVTLGAQLGVVVPSVLVFHRLPLVSLPANLLAVPVAGFVMLYGIPAGLIAAALPHPLAAVVMWPAGAGTRWVSTVAFLGHRLEPPSLWSWLGWGVVAFVVIALVRHGPELTTQPA
jgi:competence protein ComEC